MNRSFYQADNRLVSRDLFLGHALSKTFPGRSFGSRARNEELIATRPIERVDHFGPLEGPVEKAFPGAMIEQYFLQLGT